MKPELYVKSAGALQGQDYVWKMNTKPNQFQVEDPDVVKEFKPLLEPDGFSVLIGRYDGKLVALVTGISSKRKDYRGRTITNSIVWVAPDDKGGENEKTARKIAIAALLGSLDINQAIREDETGFKVSFEEIDEAIAQLPQLKGDGEATKHYALAHNDEEHRKELVDMLFSESLPIKREGSEALVVVTGVKSEKVLKDKNVWRGLSELIEPGGWKKYEKKSFRLSRESGSQPNERGFAQDNKASQEALESRVIIVGLVVLIILGVLLYSLLNSSHISSRGQNLGEVIALNTSFSADGRYYSLVQSRDGGKIIVASSNSSPLQAQSSSAQGAVKAVAISPNGKIVVSGSADGYVKIWDVKEQLTERFSVQCHQNSVLSVAISSDSKTIVSGGEDGEVRVFNIPSGNSVPQCTENSLSSRGDRGSVKYTLSGVES